MAASSSTSLESACASLTLEEEEDFGLVIGEEESTNTLEDYKYVLVGKILTEKRIKFNIMKETLAAIWRPGKGMCVKEAAPNLFLFQFFMKWTFTELWKTGLGPLNKI